jgi:hypothetical protein
LKADVVVAGPAGEFVGPAVSAHRVVSGPAEHAVVAFRGEVVAEVDQDLEVVSPFSADEDVVAAVAAELVVAVENLRRISRPAAP